MLIEMDELIDLSSSSRILLIKKKLHIELHCTSKVVVITFYYFSHAFLFFFLSHEMFIKMLSK